ncbi:MAG TPA: ChbG/HpnK family deacetylase [bacterium]|nr:ChbG/HpnK family deacetylase [bacterium]
MPDPLPPVVVVADDFGMSDAVNAGILRAFERNLITCTSLMANMPAFDAAVTEARTRGLMDRLGVHLNLTQGPALSQEFRRCRRFCTPDGVLGWKHQNVWSLDTSERQGIAAEWRAQLQRVRDAGVTPSHLDSHHHVHTAWPIGQIAMALAKEFGVPTLRLSRTCGKDPGLKVRLYKQFFNGRIKGAGLSRMTHFGSAHDVQDVIANPGGPVEVMTHPQLTADGRLINHKNGELLEPLIEGLGIRDRMVSYAELMGRPVAA